MLSRRAFAGFTGCALCATTALLASDPEARAQTPPGFTRTVLRKMDFPGDTMATIQILVDINPSFLVARHTHPGVETGYIVEGGGVLKAHGDADRTLAVGDSFQMAREQPHALLNGSARTRVLSVYVVDKDKPLATPAPE